MRKTAVKIKSQYELDTTPIFTLCSDGAESRQTDSVSNIDDHSNSPRRWTQVTLLKNDQLFTMIVIYKNSMNSISVQQ